MCKLQCATVFMRLLLTPSLVLAADRDVQIRSIHFDPGLIELFNYGETDEPLDGWVLCSHDENEAFVYTNPMSFIGVTIEAGSSLFIHFNNDAPVGDPDRINRSVLGPFATPLDALGAYSLSLYVNTIFTDGANIADHLQWSLDGLDNAMADKRSDEAVAGGLWTNESVWIMTGSETRIVTLLDETGRILHGPSDYLALDALANPIPLVIASGPVHIKLEPVATGLTAPNWGISAPGVANTLFVTDQPGILWRIDLSDGSKSVFLDVSSQLVPLGIFGPDSFDERGLLGVAFHPDYQSNGYLYTYTSEPVSGAADFSTMPPLTLADHQAVITRWAVPVPTDPFSVVDPGSEFEILRIDEPQFNHNAGALSFGPDGQLYIALGDGGGADDHDGQPFIGGPLIGHGDGNGKNPETILGSVIRIDVNGKNSANGKYGIPPKNPFTTPGDSRLDEIFAYGLRNPFRFSFDAVTGQLWLADVGQNDIEEINLVTSGGNYGWNQKEGTFAFETNGQASGFVTSESVPGILVEPIAQYDHDEGIAIVGGFVSRGTRVEPLFGRYVFGDFAKTFSNDGRLFHLTQANEIREFNLVGQSALDLSLLGFGQDAAGEIYVMANATGTPFGTTGVVLRMTTKSGDINADGVTGVLDLLRLLSDWNKLGGASDIDQDGIVNVFDLLILLANWG
ncbi:MAG: PQQ-dependent sugar dehydrogenase [Planctomycetota bacterium]|nr:PQQ-dependent sugar dehydrogenase [Planctomycetota bacterium]